MLVRAASRRRGATTVEMAVVSPLFVLMIFGLVVGGVGVFRYNQVASLAREASRYASVRGVEYRRETGQPEATEASIHQEAVVPRSAGLDSSRLTTTVTWDKSNAPRHAAPDKTVTTNYVIVTVSYRWLPEAFLGEDIILTSTSRVPMSH